MSTLSTYEKEIPKDPGSSEETLELVLGAIIFYTREGDEFIKYDNQSNSVVLTFEKVA